MRPIRQGGLSAGLAACAIALPAAACGTGPAGAQKAAPTTTNPRPVVPAGERRTVLRGSRPVIVHVPSGRTALAFRVHERAGVILLYRLRAPTGARVRATMRLPGTTVPLLIGTRPIGPSSSCSRDSASVVCTVGEEWCPMPEGTWHLRIWKLDGPAGDIGIWFHVGPPPAKRT